MKSLIRVNELIKKILSLKENDKYTLSYNRVNPKCEHCGVADKKWIGKTHCPTCGAELSYKKTANCIFTFDTASNGILLKYHDAKDGGRCCRIDNITMATIGDDEYFVVNI